jgi:hypothetical protein
LTRGNPSPSDAAAAQIEPRPAVIIPFYPQFRPVGIALTFQMRGHRFTANSQVLWVDQTRPRIYAVGDIPFCVAQHLFQTAGKIQCVGLDIPVSNPVLRSFGNETIALYIAKFS